MPNNDNPFEPWNQFWQRDNPFAPWNDPFKRDNPMAAWNNPLGYGMYREEADRWR
jgi:hypothetical protein